MADKFKSVWFRASLEHYEATKGVIRKKTETHFSAHTVDLNDFAYKLASVYNSFDKEGFDVINVIPINEGTYDVLATVQSGVPDTTASYSITRGAIVVGKRRS